MTKKAPYCLVATAFVVRGGKTLLLKHKKLGLWLPPGGHVDPGESPDEAVRREVREETGLEIDFVTPPRPPCAPLGRVTPLPEPQLIQFEEIPDHPRHLDLIYFAAARDGAKAQANHESEGLRWHDPDELAEPHVTEEIRDSGRAAIEFVTKRAGAR